MKEMERILVVSRLALVKTDRTFAPGAPHVHKKRQIKELIIVLAEYIR